MATETSEIRQRLDEVGSVLSSGDADRIGDLYTREARVMPPDSGFVTGRGEVVEFWTGVHDAGITSVDIETVEVDVQAETASRVGRATLGDDDGTTVDRVKFIELWRREDGAWRIHGDIWNSVGDAA